MAPVQRRDAEAVRERGGRDPEVVCPGNRTVPFEVGPELGVYSRNRFGDGNGLERREHVLDEGASSNSAGTGRPMDTVQ